MQKGSELLAEVDRVLRAEAQEIQRCADRLKPEPQARAVTQALETALAAVRAGRKIVVMGVGKSGKIAEKVASTLASTGSRAIFLHPTEALHGDLGRVDAGDVAWVFSQTGNSDELFRVLGEIRARGCFVVGICGNSQSRLVAASDAWISSEVSAEACSLGLAPTSSTTVALAIGDALSVALMKASGFAPADFAKNHPGGSLGKRLSLTVGEVMHKGDNVGKVTATTPMDQVVMTITQKGLGAVLVLDGTKLAGLITDGDVRRALSHREAFFGLKAQDVMSKTPTTIVSTELASRALDVMENRPRQISVLPVVDAAGNALGLVRVHDLVQSL